MSNVKEIEIGIEEAKAAAQDFKDIEALYKNKAFKRIITEGYFRDYPAALAQRKAMPGCADPSIQLDIENSFVGIGQLQQYLLIKRAQGQQMSAQLDQLNTMKEDALSAEDQEGE